VGGALSAGRSTGARVSAGGEAVGGPLAHAASSPSTPPRIAAAAALFRRRTPRILALDNNLMWLILLEAFGALALFIFIVWWTMFAGRRKGERRKADSEPK
jgi:hypothetical protein